jgi:hypothetical protein
MGEGRGAGRGESRGEGRAEGRGGRGPGPSPHTAILKRADAKPQKVRWSSMACACVTGGRGGGAASSGLLTSQLIAACDHCFWSSPHFLDSCSTTAFGPPVPSPVPTNTLHGNVLWLQSPAPKEAAEAEPAVAKVVNRFDVLNIQGDD